MIGIHSFQPCEYGNKRPRDHSWAGRGSSNRHRVDSLQGLVRRARSSMGRPIPQKEDGDAQPECTQLGHRHSLAILTADEVYCKEFPQQRFFLPSFTVERVAVRQRFPRVEKIVHHGGSNNCAISRGAVTSPPAAAKFRTILVHSAPNQPEQQIF